MAFRLIITRSIQKIGISAILSLFLCLSSAAAFDQKIKAIVDAGYAEAQARKANVPGVVAGVWDVPRNIATVYAVGLAEKETAIPMGIGHSFKIASVTKTMVATVIVQLIEEGRLSFDTPVAAFYPDLPKAEHVTIRMLGDMTSGYFDYLEDEAFLDNFDNLPNFTATPREMIAVAMAHPMEYPPGHGFNYSNTNTVLLGQIIEKITGDKLETVLQNRLYTPLGLAKTGAPDSGSYLPAPMANSYHPNTLENWTDKMDYSPEYACGNAYSTLLELRTWAQALAAGTLIKPQSMVEVLSSGTPFPHAPEYIYRFGMIDYRGYLGHSGDTDYYLTEAYHHPEKQRTVVILSNSSLTGFTGMLLAQIIDLLEE
ncbi:serine hydrolase domain-containing protein [Desulfogranum japonicum]|uniref:serine hydrolase domain-containing protein n=1 Tax=Desulfogranum japonicum TaxID=231447 RepID=UPI00041631F8|nr:serine hydrolase domain-containing protein [Desulfogranum japonicum]